MLMIESVQNWLQNEIWGNTLQAYFIAAAIFVGIIVGIKIVKRVVVWRLQKLVKKTENDIDDLVISIINTFTWPFEILVAFVISIQFLNLTDIVEQIGDYVLIIGLSVFVVLALQKVIDYIIKKIITQRSEDDEDFDASVFRVLGKIIKLILWVVAILIVVQNFGYDVTALVAGLGVGGIAIAFALQGVLSDMFSYFSIYFDKPFRAGDFIVVGKKSGTVERIGIKSTRLRTLQGEELVVSNKELTEAKVHNYKRMKSRRVVLEFGVTYDTKTEMLREIPKIIAKLISPVDNAKFDRAHFKKFGDSALIFEVVYHIQSEDYEEYMDVQEKVNLGVKEELENRGIEFAYPTYSVFLNSSSA